ncbi:CDP-diacylglycerol--glycerol-3-phosphate 3-phosphatidyltransferase [Halorubrum alkaliphilum]|uniref:CDP-diacylglycerol--glycerol-3-phosphate 3-phosphatidyltransferase n=1 Tax=Halorubrum alkaliphilum TaxID=261290 RepID=A0A8T4GF24_9EURY|nr:CDP-alcohol phosphatidyltransferase family protein [Halorubrum alkaliphilum]MBP1922339.1 CDP-diacylglycerol--glycerol-3-phosphate 3-phosphatidyltransferase [Halorubrum alkaliphilum]
MTGTSRSPAAGITSRQFPLTVAGTGVVALLALVGSGVAWDGKPTLRFIVGVCITLLIVSAVTYRSLVRARAVDGAQLITVATWVTIVRGGLVTAFAGFVFTDPPGGAATWVPAGLFATAALLDAADGAVARRTDSVTEFGGNLDTEIDALLVAVGAVTVVLAGTAPAIFLAVGVARYGFTAGIRWRRHRGLPVKELHPSQFRRATGAVIMSTVFLALLPVPGPAVSRTVAWFVSVPVLAHFIWDWLTVSGRLG